MKGDWQLYSWKSADPRKHEHTTDRELCQPIGALSNSSRLSVNYYDSSYEDHFIIKLVISKLLSTPRNVCI
jgi:hypothetical protein